MQAEKAPEGRKKAVASKPCENLKLPIIILGFVGLFYVDPVTPGFPVEGLGYRLPPEQPHCCANRRDDQEVAYCQQRISDNRANTAGQEIPTLSSASAVVVCFAFQ